MNPNDHQKLREMSEDLRRPFDERKLLRDALEEIDDLRERLDKALAPWGDA